MQIPERVAKLEQRMDDLSSDIRNLTDAVEKLTEVLAQGKGGLKLLLYLVGALGSVAAFISWIMAHIHFKV